MRSAGGRPALLLVGLLAAGAVVFFALDEADAPTPPGDEAAWEADDQRPAPPPPAADERPRAEAPTHAPREAEDAERGVPRVLPPDAAVEDVRDALAEHGATRARDAQRAYDAVARIADDAVDVRRGLQQQVRMIEDPVARGIVLAGLGANRDAANVEWLALRLRDARDPEERLGAFLALARSEATLTSAATALAGVRCPIGVLPTDRTTLGAIAGWLDAARGVYAVDSAPILLANARASVEVAALLVVDGRRVCGLYAELPDRTRAVLREVALTHDALPGAVRRVLEDAR